MICEVALPSCLRGLSSSFLCLWRALSLRGIFEVQVWRHLPHQIVIPPPQLFLYKAGMDQPSWYGIAVRSERKICFRRNYFWFMIIRAACPERVAWFRWVILYKDLLRSLWCCCAWPVCLQLLWAFFQHRLPSTQQQLSCSVLGMNKLEISSWCKIKYSQIKWREFENRGVKKKADCCSWLHCRNSRSNRNPL